MGNINDMYKSVSSRGARPIIKKYPKSYYPILTMEDYTRGYINRYFLKLKSNNHSSIIEVDEDEYKVFSADLNKTGTSLYHSIFLRWKIIGKRENVIMANTKTLETKEQSMYGISKRLGNRLQFWKDL